MLNQKEQMHPEDRRNLLVFAVAALIVWFAYDHFFIGPQMKAAREKQAQQHTAALQAAAAGGDPTAARHPRDQVLGESPRVSVENDAVSGSIALNGGRIDDLSLKHYARKLGSAERVEILSPSGSDYPLYAEFGWLDAAQNAGAMPGPQTVWQAPAGSRLTPQTPVVLKWDNGKGLKFEREISIDDTFMFTVKDRVENASPGAVTLHPYSLVSQQGLPEEYMGGRMQEGPLGYLDGELTEIPYRKMMKNFSKIEKSAASGWIGITEEYWFAGLIPAASQGGTKYSFQHVAPPTAQGRDRFQVDAVGDALTIPPGGQAETVTRLFAGAKEVKTLEGYEKALSIPHFDLAVDFGLWYFLTKPLFHALHFFYGLVGNMGLAIILLTVLVRAFVFPLANMSYRSFAGLRKIAPRMKELRDRHGGDQQMLQKELVRLYEEEKVNPMAGCLPIVVQIPIFFALYKVMIITIELRHAPFFGWIHDLSAPDPTSLFNLFGLVPWSPPAFLMIGAWPCMMLATQLLQRNMNPPPQDKMQAMMINFMPFFFCYIMARFASGLVVYWTFSGALAVLQQYVIMKSMGVEVSFFRRPKVEEELEKQVMEQPAVHPSLGVIEDELEKAVAGEIDGNDGKPPAGPAGKKSSRKRK